MSSSGFTLSRRELIALFGASAATLGSSAAWAQQQTLQALIQTSLGEGQQFSIGAVSELARQLAKKPFIQIPRDLPDAFANLNYEQYARIRSEPSSFIWANDNKGFAVEPLHRGFLFSNPVQIFTVEDGIVRQIAYDRKRFDFGGNEVPETIPDINYSGFRLYNSENGQFSEFAIIQGATFFQAIARGQSYGTTARALTLKPAETRGEEFPAFRAFWLERPTAGSNALVANGLIDSESVTGSVRLTFRPGDMTIVDVETTLFPRVNLEHVGIGSMGSRFLFGPLDPGRFDDLREAVHDASGLQILNGQEEWLWRPLKNPVALQISQFIDNSPKGFGLIQRDRSYSAFLDDERHFERRPSLWIEPLESWGEGVVQMLEIPSDSEINSNILTYWRPKAPLAAGSEASFVYRQYWCWTPPEKPPLAVVTSNRIGKGAGGKRRRFLIEFTGDDLVAPLLSELQPVISARPGTISYTKMWTYPERKVVRVAFDLDPGSENASELRLVLNAGEKPASETWLYRWTS